MVAISFYFQVHQPFRLRSGFDYFAIGTDAPHEDEATNREILRKVADRCYLPANALLLELIEKHQGRFRVAFSISGVALEQFERYDPRVIESFRALVQTGAVELLSETYYHSLAFLFSETEFQRQVRLHRKKVQELFGVTPTAFRNTELIYDNHLAQLVEGMGFEAVLAEGADRVLEWRSPNFVYRPAGTQSVALLLKNYRLSDDIAFRFSDRGWSEWPLTADKFVDWTRQIEGAGEVVNLFMDYETFGEHQWECSGIFEFLRHLPDAVLRHPDASFLTPTEVARRYRPIAELDVPNPVSWADSERDTSAWLGNPMQDAAAELTYSLEKEVLATRDEGLIHAWRKLQTSDHFYYMCTKFWADGDVHKYFSPYESPHDAFVYHANALNQLRWLCAEKRKEQRQNLKSARAQVSPVRELRVVNRR
jgi:alpha-amylase